MRAFLRWRVAAGLIGIAAASGALVIAIEHNSRHPIVGRLSLAALVGLFAALLIVAVAAWIAFLPPVRWLERIEQGTPHLVVSRTHLTVLYGCLIATTLVVCFVNVAVAPGFEASPDEEHFLELAKQIQNNGGIFQLVNDLYGGRWAESNRHPLYPALVSLLPSRRTALFVSFAAYALALAALYRLLSQQVGSGAVALAGVCFVAASRGFIAGATSALADMTLSACVLGCWTLSYSGGQTTFFRNLRRRGLAGVCCGLAYLAKATGLIWCLPVLVAGALAQQRYRAVGLIVGLGAAAIVASPLLVRNTRRFQNPLYNFNQRFLFADSFDEGLNEGQRTFLNGLRDYWRKRGWSGMVARLARGMAWELFIAARGSGPVAPTGLAVLAGAPVLAAGIIGLLKFWREPCASWMAGTLLVAWLLFGWYVPIAASERFVLPAIGYLVGLAPGGVSALARARPSYLVAATTLYCCFTLVALLLGQTQFLPRL